MLDQVPESYIVIRGGGHLSYIMVATAHDPTIQGDPRVSRPVMQAFEAAEDDVLKNTLKGAPRLGISEQFAASFLADAKKAYLEYFSDLPPLPAGSR